MKLLKHSLYNKKVIIKKVIYSYKKTRKQIVKLMLTWNKYNLKFKSLTYKSKNFIRKQMNIINMKSKMQMI